MPPVGRPRTSTRQGTRVPVNQIGIADPFNYGVSIDPLNGTVAPWRQFIDTTEMVPELFWPRSIYTYDEMRTDSQLAALLTSVMWGISQLRFMIDKNGAKASLVKEVSQDLNLPVKGDDGQPLGRMKKRFSHAQFALQALLCVVYGHAYFEQNGEIVDGKWRLRRLFPIMPRTIAQINVDDDGDLANVVQWAGRRQVNGSVPVMGGFADPIPGDRLVPFIFQREGHSWHGRSMMRDCFKDWVLKDRMMRVEAVNHERAGGVPYAVAPMGATIPEIEDLGVMMQQFRVGEEAGGAVPFGSEIKIAKGSGSDIDKTIQRYDQSMARRFLLMLANLAQGTGSHVGSYALGQTFEDFFLVGQRHIAQWYCDVMNEFVIEDIVDWNYGEDEEFVPKLTWERMSEDSLGVDNLATLVQRGVIIVDEELENAIRFKYQLPKRATPRPNIVVGPGVPNRQPIELAPGQTKPPLGEYPESANPVPPEPTKAAGAPSGAPSSETPAVTRASRLRVMASSAADIKPFLVTVPNVEILHAGWEYPLSTGPKTFTPEDLRDIVTAANEDPSVPTPRLKIGHVDPRFNSQEFDGTPAFGKAVNLRLSDNGMTVVADYVGVPKWLADIMPSAYPSRSIEGVDNVPAFGVYGANGYVSQTGRHWRFVVTDLALLGVEWPGITVLEDLPQYFGEEMPSDVIVDAAILTATGGDSVNLKFKKRVTAASANLDDVRRAFYDGVAKDDKMWWWVQAILVDPNELVVEDDETGQLYRIPFSSDSESVEFKEPTPVRIEYVPDTAEANKAAASHVAATLAIGRTVAASWSNREESRPVVTPPTTTSGGAMDPKVIRERLGLPEDASDDQVQETLRELNTAVGVTPEQEVPATTAVEPVEETTPVAAPAVEVAASGTSNTSNSSVAMVTVDKATWDTIVSASRQSMEFVAEQRQGNRERLVTAAISDGRIAGASREHWLKLIEADPNAEQTLASLQKDLVPVELRGTAPLDAGNEDPLSGLNSDVIEQWTDGLFPEVANQRAMAKAQTESGFSRRSRITADSSYRR